MIESLDGLFQYNILRYVCLYKGLPQINERGVFFDRNFLLKIVVIGEHYLTLQALTGRQKRSVLDEVTSLPSNVRLFATKRWWCDCKKREVGTGRSYYTGVSKQWHIRWSGHISGNNPSTDAIAYWRSIWRQMWYWCMVSIISAERWHPQPAKYVWDILSMLSRVWWEAAPRKPPTTFQTSRLHQAHPPTWEVDKSLIYLQIVVRQRMQRKEVLHSMRALRYIVLLLPVEVHHVRLNAAHFICWKLNSQYSLSSKISVCSGQHVLTKMKSWTRQLMLKIKKNWKTKMVIEPSNWYIQ